MVMVRVGKALSQRLLRKAAEPRRSALYGRGLNDYQDSYGFQVTIVCRV